MKLLKVSLIAMLAATPVFAGGLSEPVVEQEVIAEEARTGSRAGILVPILALILIGLAISNGSDNGTPNGPVEFE